MHRTAPARTVPFVGTVAMVLSFNSMLHAFERQLHLGGGIGVADPSGDYALGPALGIHGAYGLTDAFDLRLELQASRNALASVPVSFYGGRAGLAYKIDVMNLIPYVGMSAGGFTVAWDDGSSRVASAGAYFGLDGAVSEHFGIGALVNGDYLFANPSVTVASVLFRAEYRTDL